MLPETNTALGISVQLDTNYETALERVTAALKMEGFGVMTEIDVKATLKKKIDVDFRPYKILGACNPPLAYRALQTDPQIGLLLPCNVTVSQEEDHILVSLVDPVGMMDIVKHPALIPIAQEARARLERVVAALQED
jgi:uncharacterized protein (DUF302 family)